MSEATQLYELLVCPTCRGGLTVVGEREGVACAACDTVYPIRKEIPVMLPEEAIPAGQWRLGERRSPTSRTGK